MLNIKIWLFLGILAIGLGGFAFHQYKSTLIENGSLTNQNVTLTENVEYKDWSAAITDKVVKEYVQEKTQTTIENEHVRKEAIDEFIKDSETKGPTGKVISDDDDLARVAKLAKRMHDYYCSASPEDVRCNTVNTSPPVSKVLPSN